jgi:hypothetical protein
MTKEENLKLFDALEKSHPEAMAVIAKRFLRSFLEQDLGNSEDSGDICLSVVDLQEEVEATMRSG